MATQTTDLELRIRAALDGAAQVTGFSTDIKDLGATAATASEGARKLDEALDGLAQTSEQIQRYKELQARLAEAATALDAAREKQRALSQAVVESFGPTQQQLREQERANREVAKSEDQLQKTAVAQRELTDKIIAAENPSAALLKRHDEITRKLEGLQRALDVARQRQAAANAAVEAGGEPNERLVRAHEKQTGVVETLSAETAHLKAQLEAEAKALAAAGVETSKLDEASAKISQTFSDVAGKAKAFAEAQSKLSFVPHEQLQREAKALRDSYETLRSSGKLSAQELAQANLKLQEGLLDLERRTNGWKDSLVKAKGEIVASIAAFTPIAYSIKQASDFESALAGVRKVVDGTDEQFDALTQKVRALSHELPVSAAGLADIAAAGGQLGVPIDKLDEFVKLAAKVSIAFNLSAEESGQAIAKLANVFDLPIERVGELSDGINVLGNTTAATEGQILQFLTRVGGSAKTFGLTAEATAALGAAFISLGKPPEVAANAVNRLLTVLQTANVQTPKVQAALADMGLSASDLAERIRKDPQQALDQFLGTLQQLDGQARAEAIAQILGTEYNDDISLLINSLGQYQDALARINDQQQVSGALQKETDAQLATTRAQYQLLKNAVQDLTIELGDAFLPALKAAVAGGKSVVEAIDAIVSVAPGLTAVAVSLVAVGTAMSGLRIAGAAARVAVTGLIGSMQAGVGTLTGFTAGTTAASAGMTRMGSSATAAAGTVGGLVRVLSTLPRLLGIGLVLTGAEAVISALINIRNIQRELAEAELAVQQRLRTELDAARDRASALGAQQQQAVVALQRVQAGVENLSDAEKRRYADSLTAGEQWLREQIAIAVREQELYGQTSVNLADIREKLRQVRAAQAELKDSLADTQPLQLDQIIDPAILPALQDLDEQIGKLGEESLAQLKDQAQTAFAATSQAIADAGAQFPALQGAALEAALAIDSRYAELIKTHRALGTAVEQLRDEQFKRLGIDAGEVLTGIDERTRALLATFQSLVNDPSADPRILTAAFKELLKTLDTPQELEALKVSLAKVQSAGFDAAGAVAEIDKKLKEVAVSGDATAKALTEAFAAFGIKTKAELEASAEKAKEQYELVRSSGLATADGLNQAFAQFAEAQLAAAAASSEASAESLAGFLKARAATDEQRAAVEQLIAKYVEKGEAASRAGDAAAAGSEKAVQALGSELSAIDAVEEAYKRRTAARDGSSTSDYSGAGQSGGTASAGAIDPRYRDLTAEQRAEVDAMFQQLYQDYLEAARRRGGSLGPNFGLAGAERAALTSGIQDLISSLLSGAAQPAPGRTVQININIPNVGSATVSATPTEAQRLQDLLEELERQLSVSIGV